MRIPTVTADDLANYHVRVYNRPAPTNSLPGSINPQNPAREQKRSANDSQASEYGKDYDENGSDQSDGEEGEAEWGAVIEVFSDYDQDDGLGYYSDGVKRTLTDEQIAMFRHSELYAIQREEERAKETRDAESGAVEENEDGEVEEDDGALELPYEASDHSILRFSESTPASDNLTTNSASKAQRRISTPTRESQNATVPRNKRRKRNRLRADFEKTDEINKERQSRAEVRELDAAAHQGDQALNYGDDDDDDDIDYDEKPTPRNVRDADTPETKETPEGRKIWWPVLSG